MKEQENMKREILLNAAFGYGGCEWRVPAAYSCGEELALDILRRIPAEAFRSFYEKWKDASEEALTREERAAAERENPAEFPVTFGLEVNGRKVKAKGWSGSGWYGSSWQKQAGIKEAAWPADEEMEEWAAHYGLSEEEAWYCIRARFSWDDDPRPDGKRPDVKRPDGKRPDGKRPDGEKADGKNLDGKNPDGKMLNEKMPEIETLTLTIGTSKEIYPCGVRIFTKPGCEPFFREVFHPLTGEKIRLHVLGCREAELPETVRPGDGLIFPGKYHVLEYRAEPPLPEGEVLWLQDCREGDPPRGRRDGGRGAASIGIIGGACGPTATFWAGKLTADREKGSGPSAGSQASLPATQIVCSSLHFEAFSGTEWYISIQKAPFPPVRIPLKEA